MKQKGFAPIIFLILLALVAIVGYYGYKNYWPKISATVSPQNYEDCTKAPGSLIQTSFPAVCVTKSGARFTQRLMPEQQQSLTPPTNTSSWKTLKNTIYKYSLEYPTSLNAVGTGMPPDNTEGTSNEIIIAKDAAGVGVNFPYPTMFIETSNISGTVYKNMSLREIAQSDFDANKVNLNITTKMINDLQATTFAGEAAFTFQMQSKGFGGKWIGITSHSGINNVLEFEHNGIYYLIVYSDDPTLTQILSTFRFMKATSLGSPIPTQKACTQEAKLCPNGNSVGRTGPNCEFAPCPTR